MKAGRELDALVAEKVMGWRNCEVNGWREIRAYGKPPHFDDSDPDVCINDYSTNIADAWLVREWLINNVGGVRLERLCDADKPELCEVWDGWKYIRVQAETVPLAICLVAIMIVDNVNIVDKGR